MAWNLLLNATQENPALLDIPTFHNDMVDVTRQVFANAFITIYDNLLSTWTGGNITATRAQSLPLIDFLKDLDAVLATDPSFILGKWIADARRWAQKNETYADYLEYNARNQVPPSPLSLSPLISFSATDAIRLHSGVQALKLTITPQNNGAVS